MMASGALNHMNGRVYDPTIGRMLSPDPQNLEPLNSQAYNRYSYILNNPTSSIDPTGEFGLAGGAVGAFVGGIAAGGFELAASLSTDSFSWSGLASATLGGAAAGFVIGGTGGASLLAQAGAGAVGAGVTSGTSEAIDAFTGGEFSFGEVAFDTAVGTVAGPLTGKLMKFTGADKIPAGSTGRYSLSSLEKQMITKLNNGTLKPGQLSAKTYAKLVALGLTVEVHAMAVNGSLSNPAEINKAARAISRKTGIPFAKVKRMIKQILQKREQAAKQNKTRTRQRGKSRNNTSSSSSAGLGSAGNAGNAAPGLSIGGLGGAMSGGGGGGFMATGGSSGGGCSSCSVTVEEILPN